MKDFVNYRTLINKRKKNNKSIENCFKLLYTLEQIQFAYRFKSKEKVKYYGTIISDLRGYINSIEII